MKTKNLLLVVLLLITGTLTVFAADLQFATGAIQTLTVDDAVRIALENNLNLRQNALDLGISRRNADRSWNSLLPTLNASAMISHPTSITGPIEPDSRNVWTPGFSISAGFTFSASVIENIKKAKSDYETGLLSYEAARQEIELQVRKMFYQLILLDSNREISSQNLQNAQTRYEQIVVLVRLGQSTMLDELSAKVDMENARPSALNTEIQYENAIDSFKSILGIPSDTVLKLDGSLAVEISQNITNANNESSVSLEALRLMQSIRSMEAQRNTIRNNAYIPSLRLSWTSTPLYNIQNKSWSDNGSFSITLGFNIDNFFPWSSAKTQIDNLNDNISSAQIQLSDSLRNRDNRINQYLRNIEKIFESIDAITLNVDLAQRTYEMTEDAYNRGAADYQRLRNAGDSINQAKNHLFQEQYNLISTLLDLEKELNIPFGTLTNCDLSIN